MKLLSIVLAFASVCIAQEARIIIVDQSDSKELSAAYHEYKAARARWEALKKDKAAAYTTEPKLDKNGKQIGKETQKIPGWEEVQFSADFRAIVPANSQYAGRGNCVYGSNWGYAYPSNGTFAVNTSGTLGAIATTGPDFAVGNNSFIDQKDDDGLAPIKTSESTTVGKIPK